MATNREVEASYLGRSRSFQLDDLDHRCIGCLQDTKLLCPKLITCNTPSSNKLKEMCCAIWPGLEAMMEENPSQSMKLCKSCATMINSLDRVMSKLRELECEKKELLEFFNGFEHLKALQKKRKSDLIEGTDKKLKAEVTTQNVTDTRELHALDVCTIGTSKILLQTDELHSPATTQMEHSAPKRLLPLNGNHHTPTPMSTGDTHSTSFNLSSCAPALKRTRVSWKESSFVSKLVVRQAGVNEKTKYFMPAHTLHNSITRALIRGDKDLEKQIVNALWETDKGRVAMEMLFLNKLGKQCAHLTTQSVGSVLKQTNVEDLLSLSPRQVVEEWKCHAPLLVDVLEEISETRLVKEAKICPVVGAGSMLLHNRSQKLCAIQHIMGMILDIGGATDRTLAVMQCWGVATCTNSILKKRKEMIEAELQQNMLKSVGVQEEIMNSDVTTSDVATSDAATSDAATSDVNGDV